MLIAVIALCAAAALALAAYMWYKGTPPEKKLARERHKNNSRKT